MLNQNKPKEYLLASGETHTVKEFIEKSFYFAGIEGVWGHATKDKSELNEEFYLNKNQVLVKINPKFYRPAEVDLLLGDSSKAKSELGWSPEITFEEIVKEMVFFDLKNLQSVI